MLTVLMASSIAVIAAIALEGLSRVGPDEEEDEPEELPQAMRYGRLSKGAP